MGKISQHKISDDLYKCECGKTFNKFQSLNAHFSHCDIHHQHKGTIRKLRPQELNHSMCWENKSEEEIKQIHQKSGNTVHNECLLGNRIGTFTNKKHSECTKEKIRISTINYLSTLKNGFIARYNKQACRYIDELNNKMGWNLRHAENGGEIQCSGYYLDGYDERLNIVFEYDEPYHYINVEQNILSESDIIRQTNIINKLHCKFYRYNEKLDLFYEIRS